MAVRLTIHSGRSCAGAWSGVLRPALALAPRASLPRGVAARAQAGVAPAAAPFGPRRTPGPSGALALFARPWQGGDSSRTARRRADPCAHATRAHARRMVGPCLQPRAPHRRGHAWPSQGGAGAPHRIARTVPFPRPSRHHGAPQARPPTPRAPRRPAPRPAARRRPPPPTAQTWAPCSRPWASRAAARLPLATTSGWSTARWTRLQRSSALPATRRCRAWCGAPPGGGLVGAAGGSGSCAAARGAQRLAGCS